MPELRMVPVASTRDSFEAKVIAARLGSEGIVWELRGHVEGVYPTMGTIEILVDAEDVDVARELLLVEEVEAAFGDVDDS